jgi:hypothetical protein
MMLKLTKHQVLQLIIAYDCNFPPDDPEGALTAEDLTIFKFEYDFKIALQIALEKVERTKIPEMILIHIEP